MVQSHRWPTFRQGFHPLPLGLLLLLLFLRLLLLRLRLSYRRKPFVCRHVSHRGPVTTALLLLLLRRLLLLTSMTLRVRQRPFLRRLTVQLDPLAPSFVPASVIASPVFISDSVVSNDFYDEYELSEGTQLKVPVSSSDTKEVELPDHVNDLFLQMVEGLDLPHDTVEGLKELLYDHRETFA